MDIPDLKDFQDNPERWTGEAYVSYGMALRELREKGDKEGYAALVKRMTADTLKAAKFGLESPLLWQRVAQCTTKPEERKRYFLRAHQLLIRALKKEQDEMHYEEAARDRFEAGTMLREVGLVHQAQGNLAAAARFFTRALTHLQEASDLMETHYLSEDPDYDEGDTFPLRPRLLAELERIKKRRSERPG